MSQGGNMIIKLEGVNDTKLGRYPAKEIVGTNLATGKTWSRKIFANSDVVGPLSEIPIGETIEVKMKQDGEFWNVVGVSVATGDAIAAVQERSKGSSGRNNGSTWNGRTGEAYDRSAAIYLAWEMVKAANTEAVLRKMGIGELVDATTSVGRVLYNYIHDGSMPIGHNSNVSEDPLEPPEV